MEEFPNIKNGYGGELTREAAPEIIKFIEDEDIESRIIETVSRGVRKKFNDEGKHEYLLRCIVKEISSPKEIENLIHGTLNLVNTVMENGKNNKPVDTLLFLDKSARNGAFVFRCMWEELKKRGEIAEGVSKPNIKYINIGRDDDEKHDNTALIKILRETYHKEDFENRSVLIVDEFVSSGGSIRRAMKTIQDAFGVVPAAIGQFDFCPDWKGGEGTGILGITEINEGDTDQGRWVKDELTSLNENQTLAMKEIIEKVDNDSFIFVFNYLKNWSRFDVENIDELIKRIPESISEKIQKDDINKINDIIKENYIQYINGEDVLEYFHSVGGFLAKRLEEKTEIANSLAYRRCLREIVSLAMHKRDLFKK